MADEDREQRSAASWITPGRAEGDPDVYSSESNGSGSARAIDFLKDNQRWLLGAAGIGLALIGRELLNRMREADLRGQVALITGGSRGLGFLLARGFAREGCRIVICARDELELERAREQLEREGAEVLSVKCDVADRAQVDHLLDRTMRQFGHVDILVNNAGVMQVGPVHTMTLHDFENAMGVMFWGIVYPTLTVLPQMLKRKTGRIVNITSVGGKVSVPHLLPYNCAKFAAVGFSEGLRAELARDRIKVITIVPGLMRTGSYLNALFKGNEDNEFKWFGVSASLPFISMDAERAAQQIVRATKRGESERTLSLPANFIARFHGLFPGLTADIMSLINLVLPTSHDTTGPTRGSEVHDRVKSPVMQTLTTLGQEAAKKYQEKSAG